MNKRPQVSYHVEQRLRFIETLVQVYGHVSPRVLIAWFGISTPCATNDFAMYRKHAPSNLVFDDSMKSYKKGIIDFQPLYEKLK